MTGRRATISPLKSRRAFTLIELMVVIGVIAVLSGMAVPAVKKLTQGNSRSQALSMARAMISQARGIAVSQHRLAGVVFFEETAAYSLPVNGGQTAMQLFVEDFDQSQYNPIAGNTVFVAYSNQRQYLPAGIKAAVINDDPARGVMTGDDESASNSRGTTRAILFDAQGEMSTRHGLARPDLSGSAGGYPKAYGDWHFTTKRGGAHLGVSSPGIFLLDMNEYLGQEIPPDSSGDARRNAWIKEHADAVVLNTYTGGFIQ